jgi:hypothetical protein
MSAQRRKLQTNIGKLLAERRRRQGFSSSRALAETFPDELDWNTIAQIEAGSDFRMSSFLRLCRMLKIKPETILKQIKETL